MQDYQEMYREELREEVRKREAQNMLGSGDITEDTYRNIIAEQELVKMKKEQSRIEVQVLERKASLERAMADRAVKKVEWASYWMVYSVVLLLACAFALFIVMHALGVN